MMTYSEEAIDAAKYMSVIFANVLLSTVAIRAVKNVINVNVVRVDEMEDGLEDEEEEEEDVSAEYTQV